jgi:hypothetical protein
MIDKETEKSLINLFTDMNRIVYGFEPSKKDINKLKKSIKIYNLME